MPAISTETQQIARAVRIPLGRGRLTVVAVGGGSVDLSEARESLVTVVSLFGRTRIAPPSGAKLSQVALMGRTSDERPASGNARVHVRAVALLGSVGYA